MKQTIALKLETTPEQFDALLATMGAFNAGCNRVAELAFEKHSANKIALQPFVYGELRERFGLSSQMAVRCIGKACEAYKSARTLHRERVKNRAVENAKRITNGKEPLPPVPDLEPCTFDPHGAIVYDQRLMNVRDAAHVSLLTLKGRVIAGMRYGTYQASRLALQKGQADLVLRNGVLYLYICIDLPTPPPVETDGFLGVDLGIVQIAVDSDGEAHTGEAVMRVRKRVRQHRRTLQSRKTRSAFKRLQKTNRRQSRFVRDTNHVLSKHLVQKAVQERKALAIEALAGIRSRVNGSRHLRWLLGNWAFAQLGAFISYKAEMAGIPVVQVDPAYTSQTCHICGHCERANRKSQSEFCCISCGLVVNADNNAAKNIKARAELSCGLLFHAVSTA